MPLDIIPLRLKGLIHMVMPLVERTETDGTHRSRLQAGAAPPLHVYAHSSCDGMSDLNLLKTKRNLLYIRNQFVPRSKHFPPRL